MTKRRFKEIVEPRHITIYLMAKKGKLIQDDMASVFQQNRSNMSYSIKRIQGFIDAKDEQIINNLSKIEQLLNPITA